MKTLTTHMNEALKIGKNLSSFSAYSCKPTNKEELKDIIKSRMDKEGPECDLNDIDTSLITDMSWLFSDSKFNGDISKWDVSNVTNMTEMFVNSSFNRDISRWNVSKVRYMRRMFNGSEFNQDISNWDTSNVKDMFRMFYGSAFNHDISNWNIRQDCNTEMMFNDCQIKDEFKPSLL